MVKRLLRVVMSLAVVLAVVSLLISIIATIVIRHFGEDGEVAATSSGLQRFRLNGETSSFDWLKERGNNQFSAVGFLVGESEFGSIEFYEDGPASAKMLALVVPEKISGITIYHVIPFFLTDDTVYEFLYGEDNNAFDLPIVRRVMPAPPKGNHAVILSSSSDFRLVKIDFTAKDGVVIHADSIVDYWDLFYRYSEYSSGVYIRDYFGIDDVRYMQDIDSHFWLDASKSKPVELFGFFTEGEIVYIDQQIEKFPHDLPRGKHLRVSVVVPFMLNYAIMHHVIYVYFLNQDDIGYFAERYDFNQPNLRMGISIPVVIYGNSLVYAGD